MFCLGVLTAPAIAPKVSLVEERTNIRSDRRPIPVGYYDDKADKTFVCWMSAHSHPAVKAFDHASGKWGDTRIVAESPFADKHNYPAILRGKDEHIYMFYGCHNSTLKWLCRLNRTVSKANGQTPTFLRRSGHPIRPLC